MNRISRDAALELLKKYNKDSLIERGASQPGQELEELLTKTLEAMAACEDEIQAEMETEYEYSNIWN